MTINVLFAKLKNNIIQKNTLYKIPVSRTILFEEKHADKKEAVEIEYVLGKNQYGIYATEYRSPCAEKQGCKTTDVLACIVDEEKKEIYSLIFDVKSNISSFSDDLTKNNAALTAIKEVRDFIEQLHAEILHKKSFMLYYIDGEYREHEKIAIVTRNFEPDKFRAVSEFVRKICENESLQNLVWLKLQRALSPYQGEVKKIRDFADKKVTIGEREYDLNVILLEQLDSNTYWTQIEMRADESIYSVE